jgi:hypothetical protein
MSRSSNLLLVAADALDQGRDPFADSFLVEHAITLNECYELAERLATGARMMTVVVDPAVEDEEGELFVRLAHSRLLRSMPDRVAS